MPVDEKIVDRLDAMIAEGERIRETWSSYPDGAEYNRAPVVSWVLSALHMVELVAGRSSRYCSQMQRVPDLAEVEHGDFVVIAGALQALRDDYLNGLLVDPREIGAGEVFTDFLEMSERLLDNGYCVPASSLTGAVLEDELRRLHLRHVGKLDGESSITKLNDALRKTNVYTQPQWRQIQVWGDIRNEADHGHFDKVDPSAVKVMVLGVRDFIIKHTA